MNIIFASANLNKIKEINALMPLPYKVIGLKEIGVTEEIAETGLTIRENSYIKAKFVSDLVSQQNLSVFADDSGLEVFSLNNAPGVYSARYAGEPKNDSANNLKLINELKDATDRSARFVTTITLIHDSATHVFEGEVIGRIGYEMSGTNGFGYDPLFIPDGYEITFAQMNSEQKNIISHRGIAIKKLKAFFETLDN